MKKFVVAALAVLALLALAPASADAKVKPYNECSDGVCLTVHRDGTYVHKVVPYVLINPFVKVFGHTETRGPGFHHNTPDIMYFNTSGTTFKSQPSAAYTFNRHYPKGSLFCTRFWTKIGKKYFSSGDECVKVK